MNSKISKTDAEKRIKEFFGNIKSKIPKEIKKIKRLAMNKKIPLKEKRKLFCKFCLNPYSGKEKIRINKKIKNVECVKCGKVNKWRIK